MQSKSVIYEVNGIAISWWQRIIASKTFWVVAGFTLTAANRWNQGEITGGEFFQIVQIGVIGILIRAALGRAELAANANNPAVPTVQAKEVPTPPIPPVIPSIILCLLATASSLALTACDQAQCC